MGRVTNSHTFRLFRNDMPSTFGQGMASILDFSSSERFYNYNKEEKEADHLSLHDDWRQVGKDLATVIDEHASRKNDPA